MLSTKVSSCSDFFSAPYTAVVTFWCISLIMRASCSISNCWLSILPFLYLIWLFAILRSDYNFSNFVIPTTFSLISTILNWSFSFSIVLVLSWSQSCLILSWFFSIYCSYDSVLAFSSASVSSKLFIFTRYVATLLSSSSCISLCSPCSYYSFHFKSVTAFYRCVISSVEGGGTPIANEAFLSIASDSSLVKDSSWILSLLPTCTEPSSTLSRMLPCDY